MAVGDGADDAVEQLINTASALGSTSIDLNKKRLTQIPPQVLTLRQLEFLYLEGNSISSLPEDLFDCLPNLRWLDLRNNRISEIPHIIGNHRNLRNLLLEGNAIESLPLELGLLKSLSGLNLSGNPLEFPPSYIVERGTQEILKFLREQYVLQIQEKEGPMLEECNPESSSSDEFLIGPSHDAQDIWESSREEGVENEQTSRGERFKLPPIFQAAAHRPRNRTVDDSEGLLRGQKARTFEQEKPSRSYVHVEVEREQKSPTKTSLLRSGTKDSKAQPKPLEQSSRQKSQKRERSLEDNLNKNLKLDEDLYIVDANKDGERKAKHEKTRRKRPTASKSPQKHLLIVESSSSHDVVVASTEIENKSAVVTKPHHSDIDETSKREYFTLCEGDMVAIRVPEKLYMKGQPCLGKITTLADQQGLLTVHYYTGSYDGRWRPMMSRTSPYLRKVATADVLCKFQLASDGKMSPITQRKLRTIVDDDRNESGDTT
ncbi:leucine-rich repeat-containing protein 27-like isoform X1 [Montipora capricornis]|uniref:leucine-rich repeat-containing protein 27-like isoform X1 n=1 Tax=Montipora capricornis TaxID=246305 RepID=UPI0035F13601